MKWTISVLVMVMLIPCGASLSPIYGSTQDPSWIDWYSEQNYDNHWYNLYDVNERGYGQSFTGDGRPLNKAKWYLRKIGLPTGNIYSKVYAHTGTWGDEGYPTGSPLATSSPVDASILPQFPADPQLIEFNFPSPYTLENGVHYVLTIEFSGGNGTNFVSVGMDVSNSSHPGNQSRYYPDPWTYFPVKGFDFIFYAISDQTYDVPDATEIILDNAAPRQSGGGRTFTGTWCVATVTGYYGTDSLRSCGSGTDTYRWTPTIPVAGSYNVYVWWTAYSTRSTSVPITVTHAGGPTTRIYNQRTGGGEWVLHGTYNFNAGTGGYVEVSDINGQACADAVRFVPWQ